MFNYEGNWFRRLVGTSFLALALLISGGKCGITRTWQTFLDEKFDLDSDGMLEKIVLQWKTNEFGSVDYKLLVRDFGYGASNDSRLDFNLDEKPSSFEFLDENDDGNHGLFLETTEGKFIDRYRFRGSVRDGFEYPILMGTKYSR
jgi:hypothetical protein